jgi:DNA-binding LacI/PurR family transcriptional regulator
VLALSDPLALGVLRAAHAAGLDVPGALSVTGFDDSPAAAAAEPALTTVAQPLLERGAAVGDLVLGLLRGEPVASPPPAPVRLVVRASTAPPRT